MPLLKGLEEEFPELGIGRGIGGASHFHIPDHMSAPLICLDDRAGSASSMRMTPKSLQDAEGVEHHGRAILARKQNFRLAMNEQ